MHLKNKKIILSEKEDNDIRPIINRLDCEVIDLDSFDDILKEAINSNPLLIIGNFDKMNRPVSDMCKALKKHLLVRHIPFIVVSDNAEINTRIQAVESGATDYILKPFQDEELFARVKRSIRDVQHALNANPLTRLPGNIAIQERLDLIIKNNEKAAVAYFDIDNFKSYNDMYGYAAGDKIISLTASLIIKICEEFKEEESEEVFIGHIGGDDFLMVSSDSLIERFCQRYIEAFDSQIVYEYDPDTLKRGYMVGRDRKGKLKTFPLISISIAVVINDINRRFTHVGEIANAGAEIKKYLKSVSGSTYLIDRRK
ncbi:MAG: response regulator receiver modulated diguanylate cyclase [uncultured bacterium]|nr:MAG: response regulator receiver modulated diguanylate cyclase [uncultured bacterium]